LGDLTFLKQISADHDGPPSDIYRVIHQWFHNIVAF
jgi:hypothetical protein